MSRTAIANNRWALISYSAVLAVFLMVIDVLMVTEEYHYLLSAERRHAEEDLDIVGKLLTDVMIRSDYGAVEQFIPQWSKARPDVVLVRVIAANGFVVSQYQTQSDSQYLYKLRKPIRYMDKLVLNLEMHWDLGAINTYIRARLIKLVSLSVIAAMVLGLLLWRVLKRTAITPLRQQIEERKKIEAKLKAHSRELAMHVEELESYSYSIAHDLRAPVRAITSFSQVLLLDLAQKLEAQDKDALQRVVSAGKYMAELIDDILALSRITRESMLIKPLDLSKMGERSIARLREVEPQSGHQVSVQRGLSANGDPRLVQLLLDNLLGNAWKYTGKTAQPKIEFGCLAEAAERTFYVRDNGVGFDMQYANKLFQPFQRLHSKDEFEGTGVGLATARRIVTRHGGKIWVESEPNKGTSFYFTLPSPDFSGPQPAPALQAP